MIGTGSQGSPTVTPPPGSDPLSQPTLADRAAATTTQPVSPDTGLPQGSNLTGNPNLDIAAAGDGGQMDHFRSIISRLSGGGTPAINRAMQLHHDRVMAEAQGYAESAKRYYGYVAKARALGKDPVTGQPVTPEQIEKWQQQADAQWAAYTKIAGKSKEAKPIIQQVGGLIRHITGHPGAAGGDKTANGGSGGFASPSPQGTASNAQQTPSQQGSQTVPPPPQASASPQPTVPPPPGADFNPMQMSASGSAMDELEKEQTELRMTGGKKRAEESGQIEGFGEGLGKLGVSPEKVREVAIAHYGGAGLRAAQKMHPVWVTDPNDPTKRIPGMQSTVADEQGRFPVFSPSTGEMIDNPTQLNPAMLPTVSGTSSTYEPNTGTTTTRHTSQKVAGGETGGTATKPKGRPSTVSPPPGADGGRIATMAHAWATSGIEPSAKDKPYVEKYMADHGMQPVQKPTQSERKLQDDLKKVEPMVERLQSFLEDNKLTEAGKGGLFSPSSWGEKAKVQKAWEEYAHGIPPKDKQLGQLIKYAAAIKVMGAAPWMTIGRGRYLFSEVVKHLPNETDTPAQLYEKVQFYRDILEDAKASLPPGLTGGGEGAPANPYR